jgi:pimeloyl-ACP methyl ester carboxylesterase
MTTARRTVEVDGARTSYLTAGGEGAPLLLLHGTYWSRVWLPVLPALAAAGLRPVAVDLPGCGRSEGELTLETATVPALTAWAERFLAALGIDEPLAVAGHDIGGAIAQRLLAERRRVTRLALVNSVTYDSWPVPGVARFRDPTVAARTTTEEVVAARRTAIAAALARPAAESEIGEYADPWTDPRVARSWLALAGATDSRYTLELLPALRETAEPKLLVWGEDDGFQRVEYAERFAAEIPGATLVRIPAAGHIPMENDPVRVGAVLAGFFA